MDNTTYANTDLRGLQVFDVLKFSTNFTSLEFLFPTKSEAIIKFSGVKHFK